MPTEANVINWPSTLSSTILITNVFRFRFRFNDLFSLIFSNTRHSLQIGEIFLELADTECHCLIIINHFGVVLSTSLSAWRIHDISSIFYSSIAQGLYSFQITGNFEEDRKFKHLNIQVNRTPWRAIHEWLLQFYHLCLGLFCKWHKFNLNTHCLITRLTQNLNFPVVSTAQFLVYFVLFSYSGVCSHWSNCLSRFCWFHPLTHCVFLS